MPTFSWLTPFNGIRRNDAVIKTLNQDRTSTRITVFSLKDRHIPPLEQEISTQNKGFPQSGNLTVLLINFSPISCRQTLLRNINSDLIKNLRFFAFTGIIFYCKDVCTFGMCLTRKQKLRL